MGERKHLPRPKFFFFTVPEGLQRLTAGSPGLGISLDDLRLVKIRTILFILVIVVATTSGLALAEFLATVGRG